MIAAPTLQVVAMKITGHRTDAKFRRYAIVNQEQKREALRGYRSTGPRTRSVMRSGN